MVTRHYRHRLLNTEYYTAEPTENEQKRCLKEGT